MSMIGTFSIDITPNIPVDLNGYILRFGKAEGVHDSLLANFLFVEHNKEKTLLISLDILTIPTEQANYLRKKISNNLGINYKAITIAAIHTHSAVGGPYLRNGGKESKEWREDFEKKILEGSRIAKENSKESIIFFAEAYSSVGVNRRKNTRGIDPFLPFLIIKSDNKIQSMVINYNCHAVSLTENNLQISADYIYYLREYLYKKFNKRFPILFLNGGAGDIDPKERGGFEAAKIIGEELAEEIYLASRVYSNSIGEPNIVHYSEELEIPYQWQPNLKEALYNLEEHDKLYSEATTKEEKKIAKSFLIWATEVYNKVKANNLPKSLKMDVNFISIGSIGFIALPLEIFSSISLRLRKRFSSYNLFIISYANGYSGYLPDKTAYYEGGYEVQQWHKYAGILPQVENSEEIFFNKIDSIVKKINK